MLLANQIEDIKAQAYAGYPSQFNNVCKIYPKTIGEIVEIGINKYQGQLGLLLLTETKIVELIKEKTGQEIPIEEVEPLTYLLASAEQDDRFLLELQSIFSTFIKEDILLLPPINSVLVGSPEEKRLITPQNFRDFQDILRIQNKREIEEPPPENETPGQRKMRLLREKVAAVKKKQSQKNDEGQSLGDLLEIADVFGIDTNNRTLYAFYNLLHRHQLKEKWEQDIQMLCAGADSKKIKTKYWGGSSKDE